MISGSVAASANGISLFDILREEDKNGRFTALYNAEVANNFMPVANPLADSYNPVAGYGVPSTKFNILFNQESNYFMFVSRAKKLLESMLKSRVSEEDKLHYELLLKKINSSLKVD